MSTFLSRLIPIAVVFVFWYLATDVAHVSSFLLPRPLEVFQRLATHVLGGTIFPHFAATVGAAAMGFTIGSALAVLVAAAIAEFRWFDRFIYLHLVGFQSMPKVALSPIIALWAGFGLGSMVVMGALTCFFPVFANALVGFRAADKQLIDLYRVSSASRYCIFLNVKLPTAAAHIFSGLQIAVVLALIGTVVMEFLIASQGLGFLIMNASTTLDSAEAYVAIVLLGLSGATATLVIRAIARTVIFWTRAPGAGLRASGS